MARDELSSGDIRILGERVTFHCSNPDCNARTTGPRAEFSKRLSSGKACHIHAASPNGPRYNASMSPEERGSVENAIWLCDICARKIDDDRSTYSAELLREWKSEAERQASRKLGIPEVQQDSVGMLTQALTGHPSSYIEGALSNVARATKTSLEAQNPDLDFDVQLIGGIPTYTIRPAPGKETPRAEFFSKSPKGALEFQKNLDSGLPFTIDGEVMIKSPLPFLDGKFARVSFDPDNKREAEIAISIGETGERLVLPAVYRVGHERVSFQGAIGKELVTLSALINLRGPKRGVEIKLNMESLALTEWDGRPLARLPHFPKLQKLYDFLRNEESYVELFVEGHSFFQYRFGSQEVPFLGEMISNVDAINTFASQLGLDPAFNETDFKNLNTAHLMCINKLWRSAKVIETSKTETGFIVTVPRGNLQSGKPMKGSFLFSHPACEIPFFGVNVDLPEVRGLLGSASYKVIKKRRDSVDIKIVQAAGGPTIYEMRRGPTVKK